MTRIKVTKRSATSGCCTDDNIVNDRNVTLNDDGTFTVRFGPEDACKSPPNPVDITEGWNLLMRVYRPGKVLQAGVRSCNGQ